MWIESSVIAKKSKQRLRQGVENAWAALATEGESY